MYKGQPSGVERAKAANARCEGDIGEGHRGGLDEGPRSVRTMRPGDGERARTKLVGHHPVQMTLAVAELLRQTWHAITLDSAISNEAHRSAN